MFPMTCLLNLIVLKTIETKFLEENYPSISLFSYEALYYRPLPLADEIFVL